MRPWVAALHKQVWNDLAPLRASLAPKKAGRWLRVKVILEGRAEPPK